MKDKLVDWFVIVVSALLVWTVGAICVASVLGWTPNAQEGVHVLIVGNSQVGPIDPSQIIRPAVSCVLPGSDYAEQFLAVKEMEPDLPDLQLVVVGLSNIPLRVHRVRGRGDPVTLRYGRATGIEAHMTAPHVVRPGFTFAPDMGGEKMAEYVRQLGDNDHNAAINARALVTLVEWCKALNVDVVLLRLPTTREFFGATPVAWEKELGALVESASEAYGKPIPVWDEETQGEYDVSLFADPNHLTAAGGDVLTRRLNEQVKKER